MSWQRHKDAYITATIVFGITMAFFWPFRDNFFVYDDFAMIENVLSGPATVLRGYNNILRIVASAFLWPLFVFFGYDPFGYNIFCMSLYAVNALLLYLLCHQLFQDSKLAMLTAIIFAATGVGCDAVFWKAAFSTQLNVAFYLLTLIAYVRFRREGTTRFLWFSIGLFFLAVLSKEESASLPFIIIAIETLVLGNRLDRKTIARVIPYGVLILVYIVVNYIIIYHVIKGQSELVKHSGFRPLHTLLTPWTAFFIAPDGRLSSSDFRIYLAAACIPFGIFVSNNKKYYIFALAWVFLAFMPQSLSTLSQLQPHYTFNSVSRHLYLPSIGVALAFALILLRLREFLPARAYRITSIFLLAGYFFFNYGRVQERGQTWAEDGVPARTFLREMRNVIPRFPANSYVFVINSPTGRAYAQQSLRAFYKNPSITWIVDPTMFTPPPGSEAFLIICDWSYGMNDVKIDIMPFSSSLYNDLLKNTQ
ncbi:MAG: hypothetical protein WA003_16285 [Desulfuromonadaceae bacterium]